MKIFNSTKYWQTRWHPASRRGILQHDNDPNHNAKITQEFLKKTKLKNMPCPSILPDLNPIEHLRIYMNTGDTVKLLFHCNSPHTFQQFRWYFPRQQHPSLRRRLQRVKHASNMSIQSYGAVLHTGAFRNWANYRTPLALWIIGINYREEYGWSIRNAKKHKHRTTSPPFS